MATLFVKTERGRRVRMLQVAVPGRGRKTLRLGVAPERIAERFRDKVETLVAFRRLNQALDPDIARWVSGLPDDLHAALAGIGLVEPRTSPTAAPTLGEFLEQYITQRRGQLKPRSVQLLEQTRGRMLRRFCASTRIGAVGPDDAARWRAAMLAEGLSEATVRLHSRNAKTVFNDAAGRKLIDCNPFRELPTAAIAAQRDHYIGPGDASRVLAKLPDHEWRLLFGLARYAGLRVPSETHILQWRHVDWRQRRLTVFAPKTDSTRVVPITPSLMTLLKEAFARREAGIEEVLLLSTNNLHRTLHAAIKEAGLKSWPDLYQALRRSCETDFAMSFPQHAVSVWIGHSIAVSAKHYLQIPAELYERAAVMNGDSALQNALQHGAAWSGTERQTESSAKTAPAADAA